MPTSSVTESQRRAARVVGLTYLFVIPFAVFAGAYVPGKLFASSAAETARNIVAHERLFRLGIASDLIAFAADAVLIAALYLVLRPVSRGLALLAAFWRLIETSVFVVITLHGLDVLRFLSGAEYLRAFDASHLQALASLSIEAHRTGYNVGLLFAGLGSTVFCYLWFKSRLIPMGLAAWGVFASFVLAACSFAFVLSPDLARVVSVGYYGGPIFIFELAMGFWLPIKGIRPPRESLELAR